MLEILAEVTLFSDARGGLAEPVSDGFRSSFNYAGQLVACEVWAADADGLVALDNPFRARIKLPYGAELGWQLVGGEPFKLNVASQVIGEGSIVAVISRPVRPQVNQEARVRRCVEASRHAISEAGLKEVRHFLDHGEYEMAFEGLVLELVAADATPRDFRYEEWARLAAGLGLKQESVFVGEFWRRFREWAKARPR